MSESAERKEKFTPGPWSKAHLKENGCRCGYVFSEGGETVAKVLYNDKEDANYCRDEEEISLETARANASLIAAAPDMYAALEAYVSESRCLDPIRTPLPNPEGYASKVECTPCGKCTFCRARAALSKARGES